MAYFQMFKRDILRLADTCDRMNLSPLGACALAGTTLPVIGIPVPGGSLGGLEALLATVQMPSGIPVATVALSSAGPVNAAILACEILALSDPELRARLHARKKALHDKVVAADAKLQEKL